MSDKPLDATWQGWLKENLERGCDPHELLAILLEQRFSLQSIRDSMGHRFPGTDGPASDPRARPLDDSWKSWLSENLARNCDPRELLGILVKHKFALDSIIGAMGDRFPGNDVPREDLRRPADTPDFLALSQPPLLRNKAQLKLRKVDTAKLQLYVLDDFMTPAHCDAVAALIDRHLRPSTVTLPGSDRHFRTSRTCDLSLLKHPMVDALDERIAATLGIRLGYSEGIQGQRYDVGQQFKAHTDFFEPGTDEYREHAALRGNRTWTFMVYLNGGLAGGGTQFAALDEIFHPRKGQALAWNNLHPDGRPNYDTLHSGLPVERGHKVIITKWFREKGAGPMFYGD
jgi:prolyl 4-hydroxylase